MEENDILDQVKSMIKIPGRGRIKYILEKKKNVDIYCWIKGERWENSGSKIENKLVANCKCFTFKLKKICEIEKQSIKGK